MGVALCQAMWLQMHAHGTQLGGSTPPRSVSHHAQVLYILLQLSPSHEFPYVWTEFVTEWQSKGVKNPTGFFLSVGWEAVKRPATVNCLTYALKWAVRFLYFQCVCQGSTLPWLHRPSGGTWRTSKSLMLLGWVDVECCTSSLGCWKFLGRRLRPCVKHLHLSRATSFWTVRLSSGRAELQLSGTVRSQRGTITRPGSLHVVVNVAACCKCVSLLSQTLHMSQNIASVSKCFSVKLCFCICLLPQFHSGRHISDNFEGLCQIFYPSVQHDAQNWLQRHE